VIAAFQHERRRAELTAVLARQIGVPESEVRLRLDEIAAAGYEMAALLPMIGCPTLLLQADPAQGGVMSEAEVARGLTLLARPTHIQLVGVSHILHGERKDLVLEAIVPFLEMVLSSA
jgi:pimeloyl-ACP methyl ester carboxylesterase